MEARPTVVIGAGNGIGAEIARRLSGEAWCSSVVAVDRDEETVQAVAVEIGAEARVTDISDPVAVAELVAATADAGYVAIAAAIFATSPALETSREEFERVLAVNLTGTFFVAQAYAREMAGRGGGAIVGVASIAATMPRLRQAAYCASKAGMRQGLRVLGMEAIDSGVRVNTVSPGPTDTPMMRRLAADHPNVDHLARGDHESMRPRIPAGRVATPGDIAAATAFLLGPDSAHVALRDLVVDGGELLGL